MAKIDELLKIMVKKDASDLHISSGAPPILRINGYMAPLNYKNLTNEECQALIFEIVPEKQKKSFVKNWELDMAYDTKDLGRFRCNIFMQRKGVAAVFRAIPHKIKTVQELGLPQNLIDLVEIPRGLVVVTGPTGSGKSTTLAALLHHINVTRASHIITVEDPIEFVHPNHMCLVNQREVKNHTKSFSNALRAALREDPDIILVGEMRDLETISLALTAAETGHLVLGTLHTNNAVKTIDRIIDAFPEGQQQQIRIMLSESLRGVVAQTLFPLANGKGRVAAIEVLKNTKGIGNMIREAKTHQIQSSIQTGAAHGMIDFDKSINDLVQKGLVSIKEADIFLDRQIDKG